MFSSIAACTSRGTLHVRHVPGARRPGRRTAPATASACAAGMIAVLGTPDHRDRYRAADRRDRRGGVRALLVAVQERGHDQGERGIDAVETLVLQQVVDELPIDLRLVSEQLLQMRLELATRLRLGEPPDVARIDIPDRSRPGR